MATFRLFLQPKHELSLVNQVRIAAGHDRPQIIEAVQWRTGDDTRGLNDRLLATLNDGDYIILDYPEHPSVWPKEYFETHTELIA